jgi:hypothetical protein
MYNLIVKAMPEPHHCAVLDIPAATLILTGAIGCVTGYIGIQQWRINKNKLRLDLFDRRRSVFEATMLLIVDQGYFRPLISRAASTQSASSFDFQKEP